MVSLSFLDQDRLLKEDWSLTQCSSARAAKELKEVVFLGNSTDGVSCETANNLRYIFMYLRGSQDWIALVDPNHNNKNTRYQYIGGSGQVPAAIGSHVFDPFLLTLAVGIPTDVIRVSDYASDKVSLSLFSSKVIKAVMNVRSGDLGNFAVTVTSLVMTRMRYFAVNARSADWKTRALFVWVSLLWVTSFHTPASTMLTNKRNIALESVALLFLVSRSDVPQVRRGTSEPNEHFYGMLRQMLREFTAEELVHLCNKVQQKVNALFAGNLVPNRSNIGSGYMPTFPEWLESMRAGRYVYYIGYCVLTDSENLT